jgi:hypothetical protein
MTILRMRLWYAMASLAGCVGYFGPDSGTLMNAREMSLLALRDVLRPFPESCSRSVSQGAKDRQLY